MSILWGTRRISFLGSHEDAEEVVCTFFAHLHERRMAWEPHGSIRGYLFRSVQKSNVTNFLRDMKRSDVRIAALIADDADAITGHVASADEGLLSDEDATIRTAALAQVMMELPTRAREGVALRWVHGLSDEVIAQALETTVPAVRMQASRALKLLRERLPEYLR